MQKIKKIYICPECNELAIDEGLCSECWIKKKKKINLVKGLFCSLWGTRLFKYNNLSLSEKLKDVLKRNTSAENIKCHKNHNDFQIISFKARSFGSDDLQYIFSYWGLKDWSHFVKRFSFSFTLEEEYIKNIKEDYYFLEEAEDSTDFYLKGVIWLKKDLPGILECAHPSLVYSSSWKYTICEDCGLMLSPTKEALEKHEKEKIKKKIIEELISKGVIFDNIPGHGFILETLRKLKSSITFNSLERIAILNQSKNKIKELQKEEEE